MIPLDHFPNRGSGRTYWMLRHAASLLMAGGEVTLVGFTLAQAARVKSQLGDVLKVAVAAADADRIQHPDLSTMLSRAAITSEARAHTAADGQWHPFLVDHFVYEETIRQLSFDLQSLVEYLQARAPDLLESYMKTR